MKKILLLVVWFGVVLFTCSVFAGYTDSGGIKETSPKYDLMKGVANLNFSPKGYNYRTHSFKGKANQACPENRDTPGYKDLNMTMKWNDAWLSNKDHNGDGYLDRHYGFDSYAGSGAWIKIKIFKETWVYSVKIIAVTETDYLKEGIWYTIKGEKIGRIFRDALAVTEETLVDIKDN
ncbi:MAG: hypothetical protein KAJ58_02245 [Candidatus Pacebacteria bacterium]|nr:hypothetical protein [Candidatus Paceibacterota bacterium]